MPPEITIIPIPSKQFHVLRRRHKILHRSYRRWSLEILKHGFRQAWIDEGFIYFHTESGMKNKDGIDILKKGQPVSANP
jgi:hypothetical protein